MASIAEAPAAVSLPNVPALTVKQLDSWTNWAVSRVFRCASFLTEPACRADACIGELYVVDLLNPNSYTITNYGRKLLLVFQMCVYGVLAIPTGPVGIALRALGVHILGNIPFLYCKGTHPEKSLPKNKIFSLLSWNICCVAGRYAFTDGVGTSWQSRIDRIIEKILVNDADINCIYETFDTESAFLISEKLKQKGYAHIYFNIGPKVIGVSSGMLVASKYAVADATFERFPLETLVGRTKNAVKGVFTFDVQSEGQNFAHIATTHLQHSEVCEHPTFEELSGRSAQMKIVIDKVKSVVDRPVIVTGDLNLDDEEYRELSLHETFIKGPSFDGNTWGGDGFCAPFTEKQASGPLNLDHTVAYRNPHMPIITTTLLETGFKGTEVSLDDLSDHTGLKTIVTLIAGADKDEKEGSAGEEEALD